MSIGLLAWAFEEPIEDPLAKFLLIALADRADKDTKQCWPSLARLQRDTGMSHASIARKLKLLESMGLIHRRQRSQQSTLYTITPPRAGPGRGETPPSGGADRVSPKETSQSPTETHPSLSQRHKPKEGTVNEPMTPSTLLPEPDAAAFERQVNEVFEDFYAAYPKQVDRGGARKEMVFALAKATGTEIIEGAKRFAASHSAEPPQFLPSPARWLQGERWLDDDMATQNGWGNLQ